MPSHRRLAWLLSAVVLASIPTPTHLAAGQDITPTAQYNEARAKFDNRDFEGAAVRLDILITSLRTSDSGNLVNAQILKDAYALRAEARLGMHQEPGAQADLKQLFTLDPGRENANSTNPTFGDLFNKVRAEVVGFLSIKVTDGADVFIDGKRIAVSDTPIPLASNEYEIKISKPSYRTHTQRIQVLAGPEIPQLKIDLERISSTLHVATAPADVEVIVEKRSAGRTPAGPAPAAFNDALAKNNLQPAAASNELVLPDLTNGKYVLDFKKDCYKPDSRNVPIERPNDYYEFVRLEKATGLLHVKTQAPSHRVLFNNDPRPAGAPDDVCEGHYRVDVRSDYGRYLDDVDIAAGDEKTVTARVKPAVAMLAFTGLPDLKGASDPRPRLIRALASLDVMLFTPQDAELSAAMTRYKVTPGWLAFDPSGEPRTPEARTYLSSGRSETSAGLANALTSQAVSEVAVPSADALSDVLFTILAAGSGRPDTLSIRLGDEASQNAAFARLTARPRLYSRSTEIEIADVRDLPGPVVVAVASGGAAAAGGVGPMDVITKVNDTPVTDSLAFQAAIDAAGSDVTVTFQDHSEAVKTPKIVKLPITLRLALIGLDDRTLLPNKLILDFRRQLIETPNTRDEAILRLNLAVALMQVEAWTDAKTELEKVGLGDGDGVSAGTVQYLLGLCHKAKDENAEATTAFQNAARSNGARLTADGPLISELAKAELAGKGRKVR